MAPYFQIPQFPLDFRVLRKYLQRNYKGEYENWENEKSKMEEIT